MRWWWRRKRRRHVAAVAEHEVRAKNDTYWQSDLDYHKGRVAFYDALIEELPEMRTHNDGHPGY